jgi:hypothetical protein
VRAAHPGRADFVVGITVRGSPTPTTPVLEDEARRHGGHGPGTRSDAWLPRSASSSCSRDLTDPSALPDAVVAGGLAAIVALFALLVTETDEAFANSYSAAVSLQNPSPARRSLLITRHRDGHRGRVVDLVSYQASFLLARSSFALCRPPGRLAAAAALFRGRRVRGAHRRPGLIAA